MSNNLKYDFDQSMVTEVQTAQGNWVRVSSKTFRSWDGNRKLIDPKTKEEKMWYGSIYLYDYNDRVEALGISNIRYHKDYVNPNTLKKPYHFR